MKVLISYSFAILSMILLVTSCSPKYSGNFQNTTDSYTRLKTTYDDKKEIEKPIETAEEKSLIVTELEEKEILTVSNSETIQPQKLKELVSIQKTKTEAVIESLKTTNEDGSVNEPSKKEVKKALKKHIQKELRTAKTEGDGDYVLMMILAVLIPPLAVGLVYGITTEFWLSLLLTLLFFIPGMIYSLIKVHEYYR